MNLLRYEFYKIAFDYLRTGKKNELKSCPFFILNKWIHPGPGFPTAIALLFEKRNNTDKLPTHIFCIMFNNYAFQLVLAPNINDLWMYDV